MISFKPQDEKILIDCCNYFRQLKLKDLLVVGGAVRDSLLGLEYNDLDLTNLSGGESFVGGLFFACNNDINFNVTDRGLVRLFPEGSSSMDFSMGFQDFTEGSLLPEYTSRDFTINSIMYNPLTKKIFDPNNGIRDIKNRIIKNVYDTKHTFDTFPLRMFKIFELSSKTGFEIDESIVSFIKENKDYFEYMSLKNSPYFIRCISDSIKANESMFYKNIQKCDIVKIIPLRGEFKNFAIRNKLISKVLQ